jgi:hypothetical protein
MCHALPTGELQEMDPASARAYAAHLADKLPQVEEGEQAGMLRAIRELEFIATPAAHFDLDYFTPPGYVPGWVPNP